jgi:hypothetical protein
VKVKKGEFVQHRRIEQKKVETIGFVPCKLLEDVSLGDDENICNIHMYHHPIKVDVENNSYIINH